MLIHISLPPIDPALNEWLSQLTPEEHHALSHVCSDLEGILEDIDAAIARIAMLGIPEILAAHKKEPGYVECEASVEEIIAFLAESSSIEPSNSPTESETSST